MTPEELKDYGCPHRCDERCVCMDCYKELIAAERERCAKIAEKYLIHGHSVVTPIVEAIAAVIRAG